MGKAFKILTLYMFLMVALVSFSGPGRAETEGFKVTPKPMNAYTEARNSAKPIFLEFYAKW